MSDNDRFYSGDSEISNKNAFIAIIEEYKALRVELMFFIDSQRKLQQLLLTVAIGQAGVLLTQDSIDQWVLGFVVLFVSPFAIIILMLLQLEVTSKIILVADYIHKGIKPQLRALFDKPYKFFEWEEHKGTTRRFSKMLLLFLDWSKWSVFGFGYIISLVIGSWLMYSSRKGNLLGLDKKLIIIAFIFDLVFVAIALTVAHKFNEIEGEAIRD